MKMIVGLGNPGARYRLTRHNVGFQVVEELIRTHALDSPRFEFGAYITHWRSSFGVAVLVMPQTFMNNSGESVRRVFDFYKMTLSDFAVVLDDIDLPIGRVRIRAAGSSGGQKGIQNIIHHLGSSDFMRVKIGIGRPTTRLAVSDYVLQNFCDGELPDIQRCIDLAVRGIECWLRDGVTAAMNCVNGSSS